MKITVTEEDIRTARPGRCHHCAVALALRRATGDDAAGVFDTNWTLLLYVHGQCCPAPGRVKEFVDAYDRLPRTYPENAAVLPEKLAGALKPFGFSLPMRKSELWQQECYECEELFSPAVLDDEGCCPACAKESA